MRTSDCAEAQATPEAGKAMDLWTGQCDVFHAQACATQTRGVVVLAIGHEQGMAQQMCSA